MESPVDRLARALAIYEEWALRGDARESEDEVLERHAELRDVLEPMLRGAEASIEGPDPLESAGDRVLGPLAAGEHVGPYRIVEAIGEGGMGAVYHAEQERPVRRHVALKLIKLGMDSRAVVVRFEAERQALALMDHVCIARVFDAGASADGRPYFAMEYVPGLDLDDYCDTHRSTIRERLGLFARVCDAVHHAHQKGVIHRDLKPSNILVSETADGPVPKVIDFGVAKAIERPLTDRSLHTESGSWIGTPEYMSPEQAQTGGEDIDTRTDVYSLGVVLYELLVGELPFRMETSGRLGLERLAGEICEREPTRPSTVVTHAGAQGRLLAERRRVPTVAALQRELRGDIDWIVLEAIAKDRENRYGSAAELAADVRRLLADEPIAARPPSAVYRLRKFVRRYRVHVAVAGLLLLSLVTGLVVSTTLYFAAETARLEAERNAATAREVTDYFVGLFEQARPSQSFGVDLGVREALDLGVTRLRRDPVRDPHVRARLLAAVGSVYGSLGVSGTAEELLREAHELGPEAALDDEFRFHVAVGLAGVVAQGGAYAELVEIHRDLLHELRARQPDRLDRIAFCLAKIGTGSRRLGRIDEAAAAFAEALPLARRGDAGGDWEVLPIVLRDAAIFELDQGRPEVAKELLQEAVVAYERHAQAGHPELAGLQVWIGRAWLLLGNHDAAQAAIERGMTETERFYGEDHYYLAYPLGAYASSLWQSGWRDAAAQYFARGVERLRGGLDPEHPELGRMLNDFGVLQHERGRYVEARALLEEAVAIYRRHHVDGDVDLAFVELNLGDTLVALYDLEAADEVLTRALEVYRGLGPSDLARGLDSLALLRVAQRRYEEAEKAAREGVDLCPVDRRGEALRGRLQITLALSLNLNGGAAAAQQAATDALASLERAGSDDVARLANAHYQIGWSRLSRNDSVGAATSLGKAIELYGETHPRGHPLAAFVYDNLGAMRLGEADYPAAEPLLRRALEIRREFLPESNHWRIVSTHNLGVLHYRKGEDEAAWPFLSEAIELRRRHFSTPNHDLVNSLFVGMIVRARCGELDEAAELGADSLDQQRQLYPESHWLRAATQSRLGDVERRRGEFERAEELLTTALRHQPAGDPRRRDTIERLIALYEQLGATADADAHRRMLEDG